ncbi:MAG TPA: heme ABC exporter ATP-binding protein CcmA [Bacteroidetes bacterium]|nr:heme ABC exporter ATP-binding protein CcmA [Bacteroidota bacterium]
MTASLHVRGLCKRYASRWVVRDVELSATSGNVIGIVGNNGSGKSTLVKMIAGVLRPTSGTVTLTLNNSVVAPADVPQLCGMVAPYLQIYDEFTPIELLHLHAQLHGRTLEASDVDATLGRVGLDHVASHPVRSFSSGMRQRASLAIAVSLSPALLLLDEPGVTLDEAGRTALAECISLARKQGSVVILATNDDRERSLCDQFVRMTSDE